MNFDKLKLKIIIIFIIFNYQYINVKKRIGVIGLRHSQNVGNNLLKYALFIKLSELGYSPYMVGKRFLNHNINFIKNYTRIRLIKNFSEIKENDFDILMVSSDQTWNVVIENFYDTAFLKFAEKWKIPKFIYGTSLGFDKWKFSEKDEQVAKHLLKNFTGISVREKSAVKLIENHLGLKAQFVLEPTFLIDKKYYLNLIKNFKSDIIKSNNNNYIFVYNIIESSNFINYLSYVKKMLNIEIFFLNIFHDNQVKEFLYGVINCKAVITDSFHGTVFSILFNKPFISFENLKYDSRFNNLNEIFNIKNRIFNLSSIPPVSLLNKSLQINRSKLKILKRKSINYLKKNLNF